MSTCTPVSHVHELSNAFDSVPVGNIEKIAVRYSVQLLSDIPHVKTALHKDLYH